MVKRYAFVVTEEQDRLLKEKAAKFGFVHRSDYVRFMIFAELSFIEKINDIYDKVIQNG